MPRATLSFSLPEEREEFEDAQNGWKYKSQVEEIWNKVFRPYFKHGYPDQELNELLNTKEGNLIISKLADIYRDTISEEF
jgi:hypothetical protein